MNNPSCGYADVLVGLQYGDEGKAKIIDLLADGYDIIARFNGGANAGHTVVTPAGEARLMLIPSGAFHPDKRLYIGSGCAVNIVKLANEIESLSALGINLSGRLFISHRCPIVQPHHILLDIEHGAEIGTTGNGIGPCYADLALRMNSGCRTGIQLKDMYTDEVRTFGIMADNLQRYKKPTGNATHKQAMDELESAWKMVKSHVVQDDLFLTRLVEQGSRVLFEGAQSVLLDVSLGDQPYVTSSHTTPSFAYVGGDLSCRFHRKSIGVVKAIMSRVGAGEFTSEFGGERSAEYCNNKLVTRESESHLDTQKLLAGEDELDVGKGLRIAMGEYGTGSGRPRRIGALNLAQLRDTVKLHGIDEVYMNRCDSLALFRKTRLGKIPVWVDAPSGSYSPVLKKIHFDGFDDMSRSVLPKPLHDFLEFVEGFIGCRVAGIGTGPGREDNVDFHTMR